MCWDCLGKHKFGSVCDEGIERAAVTERKCSRGMTEDRKKNCIRNSSMIASNEMCTFLIINVSSLQLIPVNMIAYRAKYGSADPTAIVGPAILATAVSTAVAVIFCRIQESIRKYHRDAGTSDAHLAITREMFSFCAFLMFSVEILSSVIIL